MHKLKYDKPAGIWEEALPIGNGRIGGMVFSDPLLDKIQISEESLWTGQPYESEALYYMHDLKKIREHAFEGDYSGAEKETIRTMYGGQSYPYTTYGNLFIETGSVTSEVQDYHRELDMETGIVRTVYTIGKKHYEKEVFVSLEEDCLIININCDRSSFDIYTSCALYHQYDVGDNSLSVSGRCPTQMPTNQMAKDYEEKESIRFYSAVKISADGHRFETPARINLRNVTNLTLIFSLSSSFNGYNKMPVSEGKECKEICLNKLKEASRYSYKELKMRHIKKHGEMFNRVKFELGTRLNEVTDRRLENYEGDLALIQLLFDYGRYLAITSTQPGTLPANLQGIWNKDILPPWSCDFHFNINLPMNYWAVEGCNLPECHMPIFEMLEKFAQKGNNFGMKGWNMWHTSDIWMRNQDATFEPRWGYWPMGGVWLCRHIWEHYLHTQDVEFLSKYMYIIEGAVDFLEDWMVEDKEGYLTTCPSTSPENTYIYKGEELAVCTGSAMDLSMITDILTYAKEACHVMGRDTGRYEELLCKLKPLQIGSDGRLLEWNEPFEEAEKFHRHLSHLYGIYPANTITDGAYFEAGRKSMDYRLSNGGGQTGWSNAWIINLYARFRDGQMAYERIKTMFEKSIYPNMFDAHPPFQIDGNFGVCAGILEMIVQSHRKQDGIYYIDLLPAIPKEWTRGYISGIKVRGGHELEIRWVNTGKQYSLDVTDSTVATIKAGYEGALKIKCNSFCNLSVSDDRGESVDYFKKDDIITIQARKGKKYVLTWVIGE